MSASVLSVSLVDLDVHPYEDFQGIDSSRDEAAQDTGSKQSLVKCENAYCDWRGAITVEPGSTKRETSSDGVISHIEFYGRDLACWSQLDGGGVTLWSDAEHEANEVYPVNTAVTSAVFNHKALFTAKGEPMYAYDGVKWEEVEQRSGAQPAYMVACQRRLFTARMVGNETQILATRVDTYDVFPDDEADDETSVLKAADIEIGNIIGTADGIKGLGVLEKNRLAVFTNDVTLIYKVHPDYTGWTLEDKANINVGTISHNTIQQVGTDLYFCARDGVHSLKRSDANGVTIYSVPMSEKITEIYRGLLQRVSNHEMIEANYSQDHRQYNIYFPVTDSVSYRLTLSLNPVRGQDHKWSTGSFLNARCESSLGGVTLLGTPGGVYKKHMIEEEAAHYPIAEIVTPVLWHGKINENKSTNSLIVQAAGSGVVTIRAVDDTNRDMATLSFEITEDSVDDSFMDVPLSQQYTRKFEHQYLGVQFYITLAPTGPGPMRITGFAVGVKKED